MIGWENNQGAYFIQKLAEEINDTNSYIGSVNSVLTELSNSLNGGSFSTKRITGSVTSSASMTLDVTKASGSIACFLLFGVSSTEHATFAYLIFVAGNGTVYLTPLIVDSDTIVAVESANANEITVSTTGGSVYLYTICFTGKLDKHEEPTA